MIRPETVAMTMPAVMIFVDTRLNCMGEDSRHVTARLSVPRRQPPASK